MSISAIQDNLVLSAEEGLAELKRLIEEGGRVETARALSRSLAARYPENEAIQRWARIIAPPRVIGTAPASGMGTAASIDWLRAHSAEHKGKWVALRGGALLEEDDHREALMARLEDSSVELSDVLLVQIRS